MLSITIDSGVIAAENSIGGDERGTSREPKIYSIYNIAMDETASTSRKASRNARKKAQRAAFERLLRKIIRPGDQKNLPMLDDRQIADLVSGIEIANEKTSHIRYIADFTVHFSRDKIYNFLSARKIPFAETLSQPVNILTVLEKDGATVLWQQDNEWRHAWRAYETVNDLVPVRVILPSLAHQMALNRWQAQSGNRSYLQKFGRQFALRKLYVMNLRLERDMGRSGNILTLQIFSNQENIPAYKKIIFVAGTIEDQAGMYDEAIRAATYWLDNQWKEKVIIHFGTSFHLNVEIKYNQSDEWFQIKKRLDSISLIRKLTTRNFTTTAVDMEIEHSGDVDQIILTLAQQDLALKKKDENTNSPANYPWILTLKK